MCVYMIAKHSSPRAAELVGQRRNRPGLVRPTDHSEVVTREPNEPTYPWLPDQGAELPVVA